MGFQKVSQMAPTAESVLGHFAYHVVVANNSGEAGAGAFAKQLAGDIVAWMASIYDVIVDPCVVEVQPIITGRQDAPVEVVVKVDVASSAHFLRWSPLYKRWCLVLLDAGAFVHVASDPYDIAARVVGMLANGAEQRRKNGKGWNAFELPMLAQNCCFLCHDKRATTDEHVFPRWVQHRFGLWDQRVALLNGTAIPYRQLRVRACERCNNVALNRLEKVVREWLVSEHRSLRSVEQTVVFQWVLKIFLGLIAKEAQLLHERRNQNGSMIVDRTIVKGLTTLRHWAQGIYRNLIFSGPPPWTVLLLRLTTARRHYYYLDNFAELTFGLQLGDVGIIVVAEDHLDENGENRIAASYGRLVETVGDTQVHPVQFLELFARITYSRHLVSLPPAYRSEIDPVGNVVHVSRIPVPYEVQSWKPEEFQDWLNLTVGRMGFTVPVGHTTIFDEKSRWVVRDEKGSPTGVLIPRAL